MTPRTLVKVVGTALLSLSSAAIAQAQSKLTFVIPFSYSAAQKTLPAGEYTVIADQSKHLVMIRSVDCKHAVILLGYGVQPAPQGEHASAMTFNRYGKLYFLSQVWPGGSPVGLEFRKSPAEREQIAAASRTVILAASR